MSCWKTPTSDDKLFNKINNNVEHLLHSLLPPFAVAPDHYDYELRLRVHNRSLPTRTGHHTESNFINRLLFKDIRCDIPTVGHTLPAHNQSSHLLLYDILCACSLYYLLYSVYFSYNFMYLKLQFDTLHNKEYDDDDDDHTI